MIFKREPAVILSALRALIYLAIGFGLDITEEQVVLVIVACEAVFAVITRASVYAPATVEGTGD